MSVFEILDQLDCTYRAGQAGMFVWAAVPDVYKDGDSLSDDVLYGANVFITPGRVFGKAGTKYVRVSLCCADDKFQESKERIQAFIESKA
jgi:aspartate/methionine/tyrosine aminotransferase